MSARMYPLRYVIFLMVVWLLGVGPLEPFPARGAPLNWSRAGEEWVVWVTGVPSPLAQERLASNPGISLSTFDGWRSRWWVNWARPGTVSAARSGIIPARASVSSTISSPSHTSTSSGSRAAGSAVSGVGERSVVARSATVSTSAVVSTTIPSLAPAWSSGAPTIGAMTAPGSVSIAPVSAHATVAAPVYTPAPAPAPAVTSVASTPTVAPTYPPGHGAAPPVSRPAASVATTVPQADAFINFTSGPFPEESLMTTGGATAWYNSPSVQQVFGGMPSAQQQADFTQDVLRDLRSIFQRSGLDPKLTLDPNSSAAHTLSVVSGTSYTGNSKAIGITDVGANGFGFIDKLSYAKSPEELALAVAGNVAHELMHAFGVGEHPDSTGNYLDAGTARWELLTDPNATLSPTAARELAAKLAALDSARTSGASVRAQVLHDHASGDACHACDSCQHALQVATETPPPVPIPEPATWAAWSLAVVVLIARARRLRVPRAA